MEHVYLIAEDEKDTQILIEAAFARAGLHAHLQFVANGEEVMDYLRGRGKFADRAQFPFPSILLLDCNMPRGTGLEVLAKIRADPKLRRLIVVMLSGAAEESDIKAAYDLGVNSYVEKPLSFRNLIQTLITVNQYWFGCNHFAHCADARVVRPEKKQSFGHETGKAAAWPES